MVIMTDVRLSKEEVHKLIRDHMRNIHKLDVSEVTMRTSNNKFQGFDLKIERIETSLEEIHQATPNFTDNEPEKKKI